MRSKRPHKSRWSLAFFLAALGLAALWILAPKRKAPKGPATGAIRTASEQRLPPEFPEPEPTVIDESASPKRQAFQKLLKSYDYKTHAEWKRERDDRRELVRPAPAGFKPRTKGRRLEIKLAAKAAMMPKDSPFKYRLEIMNLGDEEVTFDGDGFLRDATRPFTKFSFHITPPGGQEFKAWIGTKEQLACAGLVGEKYGITAGDFKNGLDCGYDFGYDTLVEMPESPEMAGMSPKQKKQAFIEQDYRKSLGGRVRVGLLPGETLVAPAWACLAPSKQRARIERGKPPMPPVRDGFRELCTPYGFKKPGAYRIRVVYEDPPGNPPSEWLIKEMAKKGFTREQMLEEHEDSRRFHLGTIESNTVVIERLP